MTYYLACFAIFLVAYLVNITTITVFYHRGLAHGAVTLGPRTRRFVATVGVWLTGLDPKAWVCMHRHHHEFSDTPRDPHSPLNLGLRGVSLGQRRSYDRTLTGLMAGDSEYCSTVSDLDFPITWNNRHNVWYLPYALHLAVALAAGLGGGWWTAGACYWWGIVSHPIQGWIVNSLGHAVGSRNFETPDNSRNNHFAGWLILGEGYQNNHHRYPASARFSCAFGELDLGYAACVALERFGLLAIERSTLIPKA